MLLTQWDTSAHFGGPLVKDKLFFFTGYQKIRMETQAAGSPGTSGQKQWRALGKLTWAAAKNLKVDGAYQHNKVLLKVGPTSVQKPEVGNNNTEPNTVWNTRATWTPQPQTLVEFRLAGLNYEQTIDPAVGGRSGPASHNDVVTGIRSVNGNSYRLLDEKRTIVGASVTRYADNVLGRHHEIKLGVEFDKLSFYSETGFPSGLSFSDRNGVADQVTIWPGDIQEASAKQTKLYLQDGWKITDRVTLEPGLRVTFNRGRTPTAGDVYKTTPVSPRFGVAWDVTKDHKTVARAHFGRYHEALGTVEFQFTDTSRQTVQITARVLGPNNYQELTRFTPAGNQFVNPNIKQPVMDQLLIGIERELFNDFSVNVQYIHRDSKDQYGWLDTRSVYAPVQVRDPGPDNVANTADDGPFLTAFNLTTPGVESRLFTNPAGAFRKYNAFQFVVQKRFSKNWQMLAGYTRSKAEGSVNNNIGDNYGSLTVTQSPFINPNNAINATGRNTLDFPHEVIIRGSYHFNILKGFNVGGVYRYTSGQALSRTAVFRLTQGNTTVRVAPRGTLLTDAASSADVRVDKTFPLGKKSRQLSLIMDIYNVNNQGIAAGYTEASGGSFGVPTSWVTARTYQLSGRLTF